MLYIHIVHGEARYLPRYAERYAVPSIRIKVVQLSEKERLTHVVAVFLYSKNKSICSPNIRIISCTLLIVYRKPPKYDVYVVSYGKVCRCILPFPGYAGKVQLYGQYSTNTIPMSH